MINISCFLKSSRLRPFAWEVFITCLHVRWLVSYLLALADVYRRQDFWAWEAGQQDLCWRSWNKSFHVQDPGALAICVTVFSFPLHPSGRGQQQQRKNMHHPFIMNAPEKYKSFELKQAGLQKSKEITRMFHLFVALHWSNQCSSSSHGAGGINIKVDSHLNFKNVEFTSFRISQEQNCKE